MKKLVLFVITMTILHNTNAQSNGGFGLKVGINRSNIYDSKNSDVAAEAKMGFVVGGFFAIPLGDFVGLQPEILFSQKGFKGTGKILGSSYELKRTTNYIDVPILLALKPASFVTILVGPQYSYLLQQKDEFTNATFTTSQTKEFDNDNIRKNTFGFIGGLDFNAKNAVIGLRAGWDVQNNNGDGTSSTPRYKNAWLQATLGFRL